MKIKTVSQSGHVSEITITLPLVRASDDGALSKITDISGREYFWDKDGNYDGSGQSFAEPLTSLDIKPAVMGQ